MPPAVIPNNAIAIIRKVLGKMAVTANVFSQPMDQADGALGLISLPFSARYMNAIAGFPFKISFLHVSLFVCLPRILSRELWDTVAEGSWPGSR